MYMDYKDYKILYEIEDGKVIVYTANYCGIQCTYGEEFESIDALKSFINAGGWGCKR